VQTTCCPQPIPIKLTATVSGCGSLNGTYPLTFFSGTQWQGTIGSCLAKLTCEKTLGWLFLAGIFGVGTLVSQSCSPLKIVFTADLSECGGGSACTITITPQG
jgi:hypothetical protein